VLTTGDYWWAVRGEFKPASAYAERPTTMDELFADERVQESGTHSILDMDRVLGEGERANLGWLGIGDPAEAMRAMQQGDEPDLATIERVSAQEALACAGVEKLTRAHVEAIDELAHHRWIGRCAVLHDDAGTPVELYFWGHSGD
jgi:hypothetical protein